MAKALLFFLSSLLLLSYNVDAQGIHVRPATLHFGLNSGDTRSQTVDIDNTSDETVQLRLYVNDWLRDSLGHHDYQEPGKLSHSCSGWITFDKPTLQIPAHEKAQVVVTLRAPDSASAVSEMKWSMLFVESINEKVVPSQDKRTTQIRNRLRIGIHVYQTPAGVNNKAIKLVAFEGQKGDSTFQILCQNTGNVMVNCVSYLELTSLADGKKIKSAVEELPLFPEQRRYITLNVPKEMAKGKWSVLGIVDAGEDVPLEAGESSLEVR